MEPVPSRSIGGEREREREAKLGLGYPNNYAAQIIDSSAHRHVRKIAYFQQVGDIQYYSIFFIEVPIPDHDGGEPAVSYR